MSKTSALMPTQDFDMSQGDFDFIRTLCHKLTGIDIAEHKTEMVYGRIARRVRALGLTNFKEYCDLVSAPGSDEITHFINTLTTNLTSFFREVHHYDALESLIIPQLKGSHEHDRRIRLWSAGCSTGEEPYSMAMLLEDKFPELRQWDTKILATDLDSNVLQVARKGEYNSNTVASLPNLYKSRFFNAAGSRNTYSIDRRLHHYIRFNRLNLMGQWPMKKKFDVIFCRNVMIYFNKQTQAELFQRFSDILLPNGFLVIGHSEILHTVTSEFNAVERTIYQKKAT